VHTALKQFNEDEEWNLFDEDSDQEFELRTE